MTSSTNFTVFMHRDLVDQLDECFSPCDGIQAIDDILVGLPKAHRSRDGKRRGRTIPKTLKVYRGRIAWCGMHFLYVQIRRELHVLEFGFLQGQPGVECNDVDCVVDTRDESQR